MNKLKVMTVVGTRPEIIKLSKVIKELDLNFNHVLVHTGQNYDYELNQIFFEELDIRKPDVFLESAGSTSIETIGNVIIKVGELIKYYKPDAFLILGDTNSCLSAISAKRSMVPIFHMEAGNRCFDERVPEETIRKIIDHIADINLPYSDIARSYLINEGIAPDRIIKTGSPMKEIINFHKKEIENSSILESLNLERFNYFLVSAHREENVDSKIKLKSFLKILNSINEKYSMPVIVSTHPRTKNNIENLDISLNEEIKFMKPFGFFDYTKLQINSFCVLSDSGTITEESSILNFPALNLREMHERPEGFEECGVMMVGLELDNVLSALEILQKQSIDKMKYTKIIKDYDIDNVSKKVVRIIQSYTDYVNRVVWKKYSS